MVPSSSSDLAAEHQEVLVLKSYEQIWVRYLEGDTIRTKNQVSGIYNFLQR